VASIDKRLIVLDRDGVINHDSDHYIKSADEWLPLPGSLEAIATLCRHGYQVVVATNQSGLGRRLFNAECLDEIHEKMKSSVIAAGGELSGIFFCPHRPGDHCDCRKPKPGLLLQIEQAFGCSLKGRPVIGDSQRDLDAAAAVGARPILVRTGNGSTTAANLKGPDAPEIYDDLAAAVGALIGEG
jgi:D-glycero-D-manno-heptose 1,7-bisphosphate phosphatase